MIKAKRANVVLTVADDKKDYYLAKGYDIYSDDGKLLCEAIPVDVGVLQKAYVIQRAKIKQLEDEIARLKSTPISEDSGKKTRSKKIAEE